MHDFDQPTRQLPRDPYPKTPPEASTTENPKHSVDRKKKKRTAVRTRVLVSNFEPWSVMKVSLILSFLMGCVLVVANLAMWAAINKIGLIRMADDFIAPLTSSKDPITVEKYITVSRVAGVSAILGGVLTFVVTVANTLGAFMYNVINVLFGGVVATLEQNSEFVPTEDSKDS